DFDRDYRRLGAIEVLEPTNPDIRRFKAAGGKLLAYTGWADPEGVLNTTDYYDTVERVMGGRARTQDFFRLFVVPGMRHCSGGDGPYAIDYLTYLEDWVERGVPPDKLIGAHVSDEYLDAQPSSWSGPHPLQDKRWAAALSLGLPLDPTIPVAFT